MLADITFNDPISLLLAVLLVVLIIYLVKRL